MGESWTIQALSVFAGGIRSRNERAAHANSLFDRSKKLCDRSRFARLKSGNARWWRIQFTGTDDASMHRFAAAIFLTWASDKTIVSLAPVVNRVIDKMDDQTWSDLFNFLWIAHIYAKPKRSAAILESDDVSYRLFVSYGLASNFEVCNAIFSKYLSSYSGQDFQF